MKRPILILGNGQIGTALAQCASDFTPHVLTRQMLDLATITDRSLDAYVETYKPVGIINAAAYTQVDKAEGEGRDLAFKINGEAPGILAQACKRHGILFVHYSTDYVFDGSGVAPRTEMDAPGPINSYGESKLLGEKAVRDAGGQYLTFRTSWVYDATGKNFLNTMLALGKERESLNIVNDQIGAPTYAGHIAQATLKAVEAALGATVSGIFHLANAGETSWFEFAEAIFAEAKTQGEALAVKQLNPIPSSAYPTPAKRPLNSRLDCSKLKQTFGIALPAWQEGLKLCMKERYARH